MLIKSMSELISFFDDLTDVKIGLRWSMKSVCASMNQFPYNKPRAFSARKVSADQAVKLLARNGIRVNKEKTEVILDFLYKLEHHFRLKKRK
jgi:hypothetical protein